MRVRVKGRVKERAKGREMGSKAWGWTDKGVIIRVGWATQVGTRRVTVRWRVRGTMGMDDRR